MREIKFRAWFTDRNGSSMHYNIQRAYDTLSGGVTDQKGNDISYLAACFNDYLEPAQDEQSVVMQYTGILDKNGVEVYEGDIVKYLRHDTTAFDNDYERIFIIEWRDGGFWGKDSQIKIKDIAGENSEVIGNIYENSELIK